MNDINPYNQIIRKLVNQNDRLSCFYNIGPVQKCEIETFAELIVKECIEVINDNVEVALSATGNVVFEDKLLKEHFGIE